MQNKQYIVSLLSKHVVGVIFHRQLSSTACAWWLDTSEDRMVSGESCQQGARGRAGVPPEPGRRPHRPDPSRPGVYPPTRPHVAPKFQIRGENFIKPTLQLVTCNYHVANYSNYLAISSNHGTFQNNSPNRTSDFKQ